MTSNKATSCALVAILIWSTVVALVRSVTTYFGPVPGAALMYSVSALILLKREKTSNFKSYPKAYLFGCGFLFVAYEILFSQAIGLAADNRQTLEIGLINYLWPCLVVLFSLPINKQKANLYLLLPGIGLAFLGIAIAMCGEEGFSPQAFWNNVLNNPVTYGMVFIAAIFWGLYCNFSKKYGEGKNAVGIFCFGTAAFLWLKFFIDGASLPVFEFFATVELIIAGILFALSYYLWEIGIQKGNIMLVAVISYFTPLFSTVFTSLWLGVSPTFYFWGGTMSVILGALLCWQATKQ